MKLENTWTYKEMTATHLMVFRLLALIPFEGKTLRYFKTQLFGYYCNITVTICASMYIAYGLRMLLKQKIEIDYICEQTSVISTFFCYNILFNKRQRFNKLLGMCKELWSYLTPEESRIVRIYERKMYYYRNFVLASACSTTISYVLCNYFTKLLAATVNGTESKQLPFKFYVEVFEEPVHSLISGMQILIFFSLGLILTGAQTIGLFLILMACGYLKSLQSRISLLAEIEDIKIIKGMKESENKLSSLIFNSVLIDVKFHQKIMLYCEEIEKFTCSIYLLTVFSSVYNMAILGIKILENNQETLKYTCLFMLNLFQFFSCQWSPEYLLIESEGIGKAAYFAILKKIQRRKRVNEMLLFMIIRAQKPNQITAGGYVKLSIETSINMIKNALTLFTILRSVKY